MLIPYNENYHQKNLFHWGAHSVSWILYQQRTLGLLCLVTESDFAVSFLHWNPFRTATPPRLPCVAHRPVPGTRFTPQVQDGKLPLGPDSAHRSGFYSPYIVLKFLEQIFHIWKLSQRSLNFLGKQQKTSNTGPELPLPIISSGWECPL